MGELESIPLPVEACTGDEKAAYYLIPLSQRSFAPQAEVFHAGDGPQDGHARARRRSQR